MKAMRIAIFAGVLALCGCSSSSDDVSSQVSSQSIQSSQESSAESSEESSRESSHDHAQQLDQAVVNNTLTNATWINKTVEPTSYHMWGEYLPTAVSIGAKEDGSAQISVGWFMDDNDAEKAYDQIVPRGNQTTKVLADENGFKEAWVTMPDDEGFWLIRQEGNNVLCAWTSDAQDKNELIGLFDAFGG